MCQWCGDGEARTAAFEIVDRPPQSLVGIVWDGSFADAAAGGVRAALEAMQARLADLPGLFKGPLVGVSWNERPDGFRYFVGYEPEPGAPAAGDLERLDLPAMRYVVAWHAEGDGAVVEHYRGMLHWMQMQGVPRDVTRLHHREEYPLDADFAGPPVLRLMMPTDPAATPRPAGRFGAA
ncbi:MAG: GyrI-like domain-containing protein [Mesorhizobium sp.]|nr:GyrI-like domain-containing protein [Mesorhizobium sp.]